MRVDFHQWDLHGSVHLAGREIRSLLWEHTSQQPERFCVLILDFGLQEVH